MAHIHKKMKKGRPYYYIRKIARVDGKPKVINQVYLGSPDRILEMAQDGKTGPKKSRRSLLVLFGWQISLKRKLSLPT